MRRLILLPAVLAMLALVAAPAAAAFPTQINLPNDFQPEGIAIGRGSTFFSGSLAGAGIFRGDLRTGNGSLLVTGGGPFTGMKVDQRDRLWVAGGPTGAGHVFDATTGEELATFSFATGTTFINDVVVTRRAAYFTDSFRPAVYRVPIGHNGVIGAAEEIALDPMTIGFVGGGAFNLNGIEASANGKTLITVNSTTGVLFTIDPATGDAAPVDVGGATVGSGDGLALNGTKLHVVQNGNQITEIKLAADFASGVVLRVLHPSGLDVSTTAGRFGRSLYVVNARFGTTDTPPVPYWITRVDL
jgi:sugar lactone lactonase YvrE